MRLIGTLIPLAVVAAVLACSGGDSTSSSNGCDTNGGGAAGQVTVGNDLFRSAKNGSCNPAVDTVAAGSTVTWTWVNTGGVSHSIQSQGATSFTSSAIKTGNGSNYSVMFTKPGTYQYDCAVHGTQMTGRIVVQ